jgi:hypothetical protein
VLICIYIVCFHSRFRVLGSDDLLVASIKQISKKVIRLAAILALHSTTKLAE